MDIGTWTNVYDSIRGSTMKVWLVVIAFLLLACTDEADFVAVNDSSEIEDVEVQLVVESEDRDLEARIEALEKQLDTLEDQIASGAFRGPQGERGPKGNDGARGAQGPAASSGSLWSGDTVYYSDLEECIKDVLQEVQNLDIDHGYFDKTESASASGWGHTHGLSDFMNSHDLGGYLSVPWDCKYG